jgi:hypothetical protein
MVALGGHTNYARALAVLPDGQLASGQTVSARNGKRVFSSTSKTNGAFTIKVPSGIKNVIVGMNEQGRLIRTTSSINTQVSISATKFTALLSPDRYSLYINANGPKFGKATLVVEGYNTVTKAWVAFCTNKSGIKIKNGRIKGVCKSPGTLKPTNKYRIRVARNGDFKKGYTRPFKARVATSLSQAKLVIA